MFIENNYTDMFGVCRFLLEKLGSLQPKVVTIECRQQGSERTIFCNHKAF